MSRSLLIHYEAIEKASADMLTAAQAGNWDEVIRIEGVCVLLIRQLKNAIRVQTLSSEEATTKTIIMRRILQNDAETRRLAELHTQKQEWLTTRGTPTLH